MNNDCEITSTKTTVVDWRNADFFQDVVSSNLQLPVEDFAILDVSVANATEKTAGYMSLMHRVTLHVQVRGDESTSSATGDSQLKQLSFIVKEKSEKAFGGEMVDMMRAFPKEVEVYATMLPAFEKLWEDVGDEVKFGPRVFKVTSTPFTVIVMEDLKLTGYRMKECNDGLSQQDCETVLKKLAKFHVASVVYHEKNGPYPDDFKDGMFSEALIAEFEQYYAPLFDSYLQALEELGYSAQIIEALKPMRGKIYSKTSQLFKLDPAKFNVLNHGDVWINNIQFNDHDLLLLDYQISFYGSPSFDLLYFIINSASLDVRTEQFDHLIDHYHRHLVEGMQKLNAKTPSPSLQELHADIQAHGFLVCVTSMEGLAMMLAMPDLELDMDLLGSMEPAGVEFRRKLFTNARFVKMIEKLMPFMWEKGFLVDGME
ncbi:uncharacterized protein LOC109422701 [Aedes albopictus]|uniref:CHK kinase-like domain-containing protein n=1 Tax=Aedes albopictus TaxID=7160 RepID=A0ABM1ZC42_AEDAL